MGTAFADGTVLRIEYHPIPDLYHVILGGPAARGLRDKQKVRLSIGTGRAMKIPASGVKQDADLPAVVYARVNDLNFQGNPKGHQLSNFAFERYWRSRGRIVAKIDDTLALQVANGESTRAFDELLGCADRFASGGRSGGTVRTGYDIRNSGARPRQTRQRNP